MLKKELMHECQVSFGNVLLKQRSNELQDDVEMKKGFHLYRIPMIMFKTYFG